MRACDNLEGRRRRRVDAGRVRRRRAARASASPTAYTGGYAELMVLNELLAIKVPGGLPADIAALTEPLAVGVHAVAKSRIASGEARSCSAAARSGWRASPS